MEAEMIDWWRNAWGSSEAEHGHQAKQINDKFKKDQEEAKTALRAAKAAAKAEAKAKSAAKRAARAKATPKAKAKSAASSTI